MCAVEFPIYVEYWKDHPDVTERVPVAQEAVFDEGYELPSGRVVRIRGKYDSVDVIRDEDKQLRIYLQENKSKSQIDRPALERQLRFDLQTMLYLTTLSHSDGLKVACATSKRPLGGVRYNVIKRPLSGGKGTIVKHKPTKSNPRGESDDEYYARLSGIIAENPEEFFARWKVRVSSADITRFEETCLQPILEQLCDWYDDVMKHGAKSKLNYVFPFGVYSVLTEGGHTDLDNFIATGDTAGLQRADRLFTELETSEATE